MQAFDLSYFRGKSHFEEDGSEHHLVFQPMYRYFKKIIGVGRGDYIPFWKSEGLSDENITPLITSNHSLTPQPSYLVLKQE